MSPAQVRVNRTVAHDFPGEVTKKRLPGILGKSNGVRIEVHLDAAPAALIIQAHIPSGKPDRGKQPV